MKPSRPVWVREGGRARRVGVGVWVRRRDRVGFGVEFGSLLLGSTMPHARPTLLGWRPVAASRCVPRHLQSVAISCNQLQSVAISCNQLQSVAISCNQSITVRATSPAISAELRDTIGDAIRDAIRDAIITAELHLGC